MVVIFLQQCPEVVGREQGRQLDGLTENCGCGMSRAEGKRTV